MTQTVTSAPFQRRPSPDGKPLNALSQRITTRADDPTGNVSHGLAVGPDGTPPEPLDPVRLDDLGAPPAPRPQGVATR
jgi:hypothetical protein